MLDSGILIIGIILFGGFIFGEAAIRLKLPRVSGYLLAGILFNPHLFQYIPKSFPEHTHIITEMALAIITFLIGGELAIHKLKKLGSCIIKIAIYQAQITFLVVSIGMFFIMPFFFGSISYEWKYFLAPICILLGALALPTDPAAVLAVMHEYKAKGNVSTAILGIAAIDDILTFINFAIAIVLTKMTIIFYPDNLSIAIGKTILILALSGFVGALFGIAFNLVSKEIEKYSGGIYLVVTIGFIALCFGFNQLFQLDELFSTMVMGMIVVNFNDLKSKVFHTLSSYTEELIFLLFFTFSGMHLDLNSLGKVTIPILVFIVLRTIGKLLGTWIGCKFSNAPKKITKYAGWGLLPQGGIVLGLAMIIYQNPDFKIFSNAIMSLVIGATLFHEILGPIIAKYALKKAGEIKP
jgi:Kef-type K+ transport system membrane component KefB